MREQCTHRTRAGPVIRGKSRSRRAFYIAGPTCVAPGIDILGTMYGKLVSAIPEADFLLPNLGTPGRGGRLHG